MITVIMHAYTCLLMNARSWDRIHEIPVAKRTPYPLRHKGRCKYGMHQKQQNKQTISIGYTLSHFTNSGTMRMCMAGGMRSRLIIYKFIA